MLGAPNPRRTRLTHDDDDFGADMNGLRWLHRRRVVVASQDGNLRIWDARTGEPTGRLERSGGWARSLAMSPSARLLADAGAAGTVRFTALPRRRPIATAARGDAPVWGLAFRPDGQLLAAACGDGTLRSSKSRA